MSADNPKCVAELRKHEDPLYATAPHKSRAWFLLEWEGDWPHNAVAALTLPESLRSFWEETLPSIPRSRRLLIRDPSRTSPTPSLTVILSGVQEPRGYRLGFQDPEELHRFNIPAMIEAGLTGVDSPWEPIEEPLVLVCANPHHDRCCARGHALCASLRREGLFAYESTHIGGHRFAATAVVFPKGAYYGLLDLEDVPAFARSLADERILLDHYRGWIGYTPAVQAADYFLRRELNHLDVHGLVCVSDQGDEAGHRAVFEVASSGERFEVRVAPRRLGTRLVSCRADGAKSKEVSTFECQQITHLSTDKSQR